MKTNAKVIEALRDGEQRAEEVAVNATLSYSTASSALRVLMNRGVVGSQTDQGDRVYFLTGRNS